MLRCPLAVLLLAPCALAQDDKKPCGKTCCDCEWCGTPRKWYESDELWKKHNVCWSTIAKFTCTHKTRKSNDLKKSGPDADIPVLKEALAEAAKQGRMVLLIGTTGG